MKRFLFCVIRINRRVFLDCVKVICCNINFFSFAKDTLNSCVLSMALKGLRCGEFARSLKGLYIGGFGAILRGLNLGAFARRGFILRLQAFTLVEMLMALLIVSVILSASLPVISSRTKSQAAVSSKYSSVPIGMIAMWKVDGALPDNTWLEANGQAIPNGIEYEQCRKVYGSRLPDLRGADNEFYTNLNNYLSKDIKNYLQSAIKPLPKDGIIIWGTNAAIPEGWSEATEYRGVFLRGYGSLTHTQNNGTTIGNTATTHSSGEVGAVQGDGVRNIKGQFYLFQNASWLQFPSRGVLYNTSYREWKIFGFNTGHHADVTEVALDASRATPTANEIRPINKAVRYIKYSSMPVTSEMPGMSEAHAMPDMPEAPSYTKRFRYIVEV